MWQWQWQSSRQNKVFYSFLFQDPDSEIPNVRNHAIAMYWFNKIEISANNSEKPKNEKKTTISSSRWKAKKKFPCSIDFRYDNRLVSYFSTSTLIFYFTSFQFFRQVWFLWIFDLFSFSHFRTFHALHVINIEFKAYATHTLYCNCEMFFFFNLQKWFAYQLIRF